MGHSGWNNHYCPHLGGLEFSPCWLPSYTVPTPKHSNSYWFWLCKWNGNTSEKSSLIHHNEFGLPSSCLNNTSPHLFLRTWTLFLMLVFRNGFIIELCFIYFQISSKVSSNLINKIQKFVKKMKVSGLRLVILEAFIFWKRSKIVEAECR